MRRQITPATMVAGMASKGIPMGSSLKLECAACTRPVVTESDAMNMVPADDKIVKRRKIVTIVVSQCWKFNLYK